MKRITTLLPHHNCRAQRSIFNLNLNLNTNPRRLPLPFPLTTNHPRNLHTTNQSLQQSAAQKQPTDDNNEPSSSTSSTNPQMAFPCLDRLETRTSNLLNNSTPIKQFSSGSGPEPSYTTGPHHTFHSSTPLTLDWGGILPTYTIAYETWGTLNPTSSNAILLHTGLSASSHAHSTELNPSPGWWEKFIGPGKALDTNRYFIICTNVIGGCYGSTGPSSIDPSTTIDKTKTSQKDEDNNNNTTTKKGTPYATKFPIVTLEDMVRAQFTLLDHLGIKKLYASVGSSMGGMQSLAAGVLFPDRVGKVVSISGCARSHPYSVAMRFVQRQVLMSDPNWSRGHYYTSIPPHVGMKLAREIATVTYRSGPEWELRFGRKRADPTKPPALCPDFLIETYLDHAGEKWCLEYDANSLLYISKAMDLFDLGDGVQREARRRREGFASRWRRVIGGEVQEGEEEGVEGGSCTLTLPEEAYTEQEEQDAQQQETTKTSSSTDTTISSSRKPPADLVAGLSPLKDHEVLVIGVASDILFPAWQQREIVYALQEGGNGNVKHVELGEDVSMFGHDTFLLDTVNVGGVVKEFLS
ncbi:hypothetical protein TWF730_006598 [Orbilia blumenaviensis]|uniref:AB hydrolase-1 domain-containing protein n=1 Tax=Orbilia blumenaviensis TaxID=1796055 RepID=A0AAV9VHQ9_9PEZI